MPTPVVDLAAALKRLPAYEKRHCIQKLLDMGDLNLVQKILLARDSSGRNAWLVAKERVDPIGYLLDLQRTRHAAMRHGPTSAPIALPMAVLEFLAREELLTFIPALIPPFVVHQLWTLDQARAVARLLPRQAQAETLIGLLATDPDNKQEIFNQALEALDRTANNRDKLLLRLAELGPPERLPDLVGSAHSAEEVCDLLSVLPSEHAARAIDRLRSFVEFEEKHPYDIHAEELLTRGFYASSPQDAAVGRRTRLLAIIAEHSGKSSDLDRVRKSAGRISDPTYRLSVILNFLDLFPTPVQKRAMNDFVRLGDTFKSVLERCGPRLPETLLAVALDRTRDDPVARSYVFAHPLLPKHERLAIIRSLLEGSLGASSIAWAVEQIGQKARPLSRNEQAALLELIKTIKERDIFVRCADVALRITTEAIAVEVAKIRKECLESDGEYVWQTIYFAALIAPRMHAHVVESTLVETPKQHADGLARTAIALPTAEAQLLLTNIRRYAGLTTVLDRLEVIAALASAIQVPDIRINILGRAQSILPEVDDAHKLLACSFLVEAAHGLPMAPKLARLGLAFVTGTSWLHMRVLPSLLQALPLKEREALARKHLRSLRPSRETTRLTKMQQSRETARVGKLTGFGRLLELQTMLGLALVLPMGQRARVVAPILRAARNLVPAEYGLVFPWAVRYAPEDLRVQLSCDAMRSIYDLHATSHRTLVTATCLSSVPGPLRDTSIKFLQQAATDHPCSHCRRQYRAVISPFHQERMLSGIKDIFLLDDPYARRATFRTWAERSASMDVQNALHAFIATLSTQATRVAFSGMVGFAPALVRNLPADIISTVTHLLLTYVR